MSNDELVPYGRDSQLWTSREWAAAVAGRGEGQEARAVVRDSWSRSLSAAVPPDMPRAPIAFDDDALHTAQHSTDWLPFAHRAADHLRSSSTAGHVLSLFDAEGRMLDWRGDPAALDGLGGINFRPGGLWSERAVGTNGPGTALATGRPVHIVGAEHFCESWHDWHCAAVPVHDPMTGDVIGVIDISGFRRYAHPHSLELAVALAAAVEHMLTAREAERRFAVMHRAAELTTRYAGDPLVAVDRAGRVLYANGAAPAGLRPGTVTPDALRSAIAAHVHQAGGADAREVLLQLHEDVGLTAVSYPVLDGRVPVGACLLLTGGAGVAQRAAAPPVHAAVDSMRKTTTPPSAHYCFLDVVGQSPKLADAFRVASAAASNALPVLILGESGTGKEVFAQSIHRAGSRRDRPFVAVNCASLPRELVESELFGYVGGAFSGARREGSPGKFQAAHGGTIFLDEIVELPPAAQASLLRVLQEGEVTAVGCTHGKRVDVRVIAATNRDMRAALASGRLRSDLYYRLNVLSIELPPLRDRRSDVPALAEHFLDVAASEVGRPGLSFGPGVIEALQRADWPGNVRELKNLVRRLAALSSGHRITLADLPPELSRADRPLDDATERGDVAWRTSGAPDEAPDSASDSSTATARAAAERARTLDAVARAHTMAEAAELLGVRRSTLYRRLERYGLRPERLLRTH